MDFWQNFKVEVEKSAKMNCTIIQETEEVKTRSQGDDLSGKNIFQEQEGGEVVSDGGVFTGKVVELQPSTGASKTGKPVVIYFNKFTLELCSMLKDLSSWFFVGDRLTRVRILSNTNSVSTFY